MIFVDNLDKTHACPNCGHKELECWYNINTEKKSRHCPECDETIFQKELDLTVIRSLTMEEPVSIYASIRDLEYEISDLTRLATSPNELAQLEKIRDIFYEMLDIMKEIK